MPRLISRKISTLLAMVMCLGLTVSDSVAQPTDPPLVSYRGSDIDMSDPRYLDELSLCASYYLLLGVMRIDEEQLESLAGIWNTGSIEDNAAAVAELLSAFNHYVSEELDEEDRELISNSFQAGANYLDLALEHYPQEQVGDRFSAQLVSLIQSGESESETINKTCMDWQRMQRRRFRNRG